MLVLVPVQLLPGWLTQDTHHPCSGPVSLAVCSVSHSLRLTVVGKAALLAGTCLQGDRMQPSLRAFHLGSMERCACRHLLGCLQW